MDRTAKITLFFDSFSEESKNLYESFKNAGIPFNAVSIETDGFLPDDVMSVYEFFLGDFSKSDKCPGKPRYFNQIDIPKFWEIASSNASGKVMNLGKEMARIFYANPTNKRLVRLVDWVNEAGVVRLNEHYNKYGALFSKTTFSKKGYKVSTSYFDADGKEVIMEHLATGNYIVNWQGKEYIFHSKAEFIVFFLKCSGLDKTKLYFNSLSFPFQVSQLLPANDFGDILFWNEPVGDEIPGNMKMILEGNATRTKKIFVQRKESYDKLISLGASPEIVKPLGYIYSFIRENKCRPEALICTNSENVAKISELVQMAPDMHFHIAAITEMSTKLMAMDDFKNVTLYPTAKSAITDELFDKCDIYLDINREGEILDAVHRAFLNNMLIVGFEETLHNRKYISDTNIFPEEEYENLGEALAIVSRERHLIGEALVKQLEEALSEDKKAYGGIEF